MAVLYRVKLYLGKSKYIVLKYDNIVEWKSPIRIVLKSLKVTDNKHAFVSINFLAINVPK